jgi:trans-aconitate methyltransferase
MTAHNHSRSEAKLQAQAIIDAASDAFERGAIGEAEWQRRVTDALSRAYLSETDPRWGSGFDGDPALWREARELILQAVPRDGSFLDIGCANGHLMESLRLWATERGLRLELSGLELNPSLAAAARERLPEVSDRIFGGNAADWIPPHRFTYVRTGLEYVPAGREASLVARLLSEVVEHGGRLLIGPVSASSLQPALEAVRTAGVVESGVEQATDRNGKTRYVVWACPNRD